MRLFLIRHGQTPGNVLGQLDTAHPGPGLTGLGHSQAVALARTFAHVDVDALFASTLVRTQLTAAPLSAARKIAVEVLAGLHEIGAGDLELRSDPDSIRRYVETVYAWGLGDLEAKLPGGADGNDFFARFDSDVATMANSGVNAAAAFSHGAAIRVWVSSRAVNVTPEFGTEHALGNTGVVTLEGSPAEGWVLTDWAGTPIDR
ncbi:MAG: histidine phosphatase family protein [Terrimesophilobacter sp.]